MQLIRHEVSQRALRCPKLFIIYVNDMCDMTKLVNILFYDETNIFCSASDVNQLGNIVSVTVKCIYCYQF